MTVKKSKVDNLYSSMNILLSYYSLSYYSLKEMNCRKIPKIKLFSKTCLKIKGYKNIYPANINQKQVGLIVLITD